MTYEAIFSEYAQHVFIIPSFDSLWVKNDYCFESFKLTRWDGLCHATNNRLQSLEMEK